MTTQFLFAGCGLTVLGLILATAGFISIQPALRSLRWKPVEGQVVGNEEELQGGVLRYRYRAGDRQFLGSRIAFHQAPGSGESRYKPGQNVTVYYDPAAPDHSVLVPGPGMAAYLPVGLGGFLFVIGLILGMLAYVVH